MADGSVDMRRAVAMEADLQRCMVMLGSVGAEEQGRLLRVGGLLEDLRDTVARVHRAVLTSHGMRYGKLYERLLIPASTGLREALERVLVLRLRGSAGSFLARLVYRRLVVGKLWRSLWEFMVIEFHLNPKHRHDEVAERVQELAVYRRTSSQFEQPMVGTSDLVKKMVKFLLAATNADQSSSSSSPPPPLVIMPIVGGPGTGKTRVAQALFDDDDVCRAFGAVRAWVHVSQRYDLRRVLWGILASLLEQVRQGEEELGPLREGIKSALYMRWHLAGSDEAQLPDEGPEKWMEHIRLAMETLHDVLSGRRYLLVLDDVWDEKVEEWRYLMTQALPPNATIVLTTRIPDVADAMATIEMAVTKPFFLQPQLFELSQLLQNDSYSGDRSGEPVDKFTKDIAANCDGVPLLLRHAGSLLDQMKGEGSLGKPDIFSSQEYFWQQLLDLPEVARDVLQCAYASYRYLPSDLKKCLLYCSVFPLDYSFDAQELADLLAAEGFIRPTMTEAERKGILQHLLGECFRPVKDSEHGWKIAYRMHKVLHIFAQYIHRQFSLVIRVGDVNHASVGQDTTTDTSIQYASLVVPPLPATFPNYLFNFRDLRTLMLLHEEKMWSADRRCEITNIPDELCESLRDLRTLSFQGCKIRTLPSNFEMLSYLRYLNLSRTDIETIPSSISKLSFLQTLKLSHCESLKNLDEHISKLVNLQVLDLEGCHQITDFPQNMSRIRGLVHLNLSQTCIGSIPRSISKLQFLQTLKLSRCRLLRKLHEKISKLVQLQELDLEGCHYLAGLPQDISKIKSLSHLNVLECPCLTEMPRGMGQLTNLQTLLRYAVSNNGGSAISELGSLRNLQILSLVILKNVESRDANNLQNKQELESLAVQWNTDDERTSSTAKEVLQHLQPNQGLKILEIVAYERKEFPSWMTEKDPYLKSLVEIRLVNINACETLPPLGLLPCLKIAEICGAEAIVCVDDHFYGDKGTFPSLEKLTFAYMKILKTWIQVRKNATFPRLTEVTIIQCPELSLQVELPSVEKLNLWMNNKILYSSKGGLGGVAQSLEHVSICFCEELGASAEGQESVGLQNLRNIEELEICGCGEMTRLPQSLQHSSIRSLTIDSCCKLQTLPDWLENLPLRLLCLSACPMLKSIPAGLGQHPGFKKIIEACPNLSAQSSGKSSVTVVSKSKETIE